MDEQEMKKFMDISIDMETRELTNLELAALNIVAQLNEDPRGRLFDYEKVKGLFTEDNGTRMHVETKMALAIVVNERLNQ